MRGHGRKLDPGWKMENGYARDTYLPDTHNGVSDKDEEDNEGFNECRDGVIVVFKEGKHLKINKTERKIEYFERLKFKFARSP